MCIKYGLKVVALVFFLFIWSSSMCFRYYFHFCRGNNSLKDPASKSYDQVFRPHHGWVIQKAVALGMCALPTRSQLLTVLNEEGECINSIHTYSCNAVRT